ncbi:MAG: PEP-CTERM sorting domain-containing protein [Phycisphaerae bacterium]|nr:PEP-CTERM sorting domain-containing protein [Phycisphaerae bacterium]NUQ47266.1 PEP-CTERM sorting domain-containing protein [Phycisphaerae bacterium]
MRRISGVLAVAAVLAIGSAANAAYEYHVYFGPASVNAPVDFTPGVNNVNPLVDAEAGDIVSFPIYMSIQRGDSTQPFVNLFGYGINTAYLATGTGGAALSATANMTPLPYDTLGAGPIAGTNPHNGATLLSLMTATAPPGSVGFTSNGSGVQPSGLDQWGLPTYLMGWVSFQVNGAVGDRIDLYMQTNLNTPRFTSNSGTGSHNNVAFGYDPTTGLPDDTRILNGVPSGNPIGTLANQITATPDAVINIIPEPATLSLLALGLLGIRRRRA